MANRLKGKTAIISGGSRGIGAATALRFAAEGADVAITYVGNHVAAERVTSAIAAAGQRGFAFRANAAEASALRTAAEEAALALEGVDILVHSAGVAEFVNLEDTSEDLYLEAERRHFAINVGGVVALTKSVLPHLRSGGRILVIGSVNAHQMPFPGTAIYGASKAAVAALARGWARDLGHRNILVNAIQPGPVDTEMNPDDEREAVTHMKGMTALKRYGKAEEIAALACFLASDEASYITGAVIDIDGGFSV